MPVRLPEQLLFIERFAFYAILLVTYEGRRSVEDCEGWDGDQFRIVEWDHKLPLYLRETGRKIRGCMWRVFQ